MKLKVYSEIAPDMQSNSISLAMGFFDGVHIGHRKVIEAALHSGYTSGVLTFAQHPLSVIDGKAPPELIGPEDKIKIIDGMGIDRMYMPNFTSVKDITANDFIIMLKRRLNLISISCGYNFHLGRDKADVCRLGKICAEQGIELNVSDAVNYKGKPVSSTRIRKAIENGNMPLVSGMLGRQYGFTLEVIHGDERGRLLGFPTINQQLPEGVAVPKHGVYISMVNTGTEWRPGITNIGLRPTYSVPTPLVETHILDYSGDLYGRKIEIRLFDFLREERKFSSAKELKEAVMANIKQAQSWYKAYNGDFNMICM